MFCPLRYATDGSAFRLDPSKQRRASGAMYVNITVTTHKPDIYRDCWECHAAFFPRAFPGCMTQTLSCPSLCDRFTSYPSLLSLMYRVMKRATVRG
jgi:hypothetical protein